MIITRIEANEMERFSATEGNIDEADDERKPWLPDRFLRDTTALRPI